MVKETNLQDKHVTLFTPDAASDGLPLVVLNTYQDEGRQVWNACRKLSCPSFALVSIGRVNWDDDMTPWPIPPISDKDTPCGGLAAAYLETLTGRIIPWARENMTCEPVYQAIAGYSLAGLFALYCLYRTDIFSRAASASGSLWYPDFLDYARQNRMPRIPERVYFSLGDRESHTRNKFLAPVEERTREIERYFSGIGIQTVYESNPGDHYHDTIYRMAKGIVWILKEENGNEMD